MSEEMNYAEQTFNEGDIVKGIAAQVDERQYLYQFQVHRLMVLYRLVNYQAYTLRKRLMSSLLGMS